MAYFAKSCQQPYIHLRETANQMLLIERPLTYTFVFPFPSDVMPVGCMQKSRNSFAAVE